MTETAVEVTGLTKRYGSVLALDNLDLSLPYGRIVGLLGENGCGKTTLLKILAGVLADHQGQVRIAGQALGPESKAKVSFLPDVSFLPPSSTVTQIIGWFSDFFRDFDREQASELIGFFGLDERQKLKQMSKGMREKVQVAMSMSRRARVYLLDEPISGVDPAARQVILDGILRGLSDDSLLMVSTHLVHDLEPVLDHVVMMRHGRVLLSGEVDDLRAEHRCSLEQLFKEVHR